MKIEKFQIKNYRSLYDFKIDSFDSTTIFYGLNNAGKSNIISALEIIFKEKKQLDRGELTLPTNFYEGVIEDFSNNYYNNNIDTPIEFSVEMSIENSELDIDEVTKGLFNKPPKKNMLQINGIITNNKAISGAADMITEIIKLNNKIIYAFDKSLTKYTYFPTLLSKDQKNSSILREAFTKLIYKFNNCIYVIGSGRDMFPAGLVNNIELIISPHTFKSFLHSLYLSEEKYQIFEKINKVFNSEPFGFGDISFAIIDNNVEIMIKEKDNEVRLPIKHLGSGILQILYIITSIICNENKIICIEELEQNLSPRLQKYTMRKIQTMIGNSLYQIIISSHSIVFAKPKYSKDIYLIKKEGSKTVISGKIEKKFNKVAKEHFIDVMPSIRTYTIQELKDFENEETSYGNG